MKLLLALAGAFVVAEAAVLAFWPREGLIAPAEVPVLGYFSPAEVARAEAYRGPQAALYALGLALEIAVLALLLRRAPRRPLLAGAVLALAVTAATLPVAAIARQRALDVGLATQPWAGWARDVAVDAAIGAAIAAVGAVVAAALIRRFPRRWWLPAAGIVVAFAVLTTYATPVVIDPLFNRFEPLPPGQTRADVVELAERAGVDVGQVLTVDASRRTTAANAYVAGLGDTKRVVLYDTLLEDFTRDEVRLVVAHELGHVHHRDVPKGLLWVALVAPAGMFAASRLVARLPGPPIPALALALAILVPVITMISNQLSRAVEARADAYSLRLTGAPEAFIGFERRIATKNLNDPDPPGLLTALLATHPPTIERIGIAEAFRSRSSGSGARPPDRGARRPARTRAGP